MPEIIRKIKNKWLALDSLEDRVFFLTAAVSLIAGVVVCVTNHLQGLSMGAQITAVCILVFTALFLYLGIRFPAMRGRLRLILVLGMNFAFFPLSFFSAGGIHSGMILFYLVGLFLVAVMLRGNLGGIVFLVSLLCMLLSIELAQHFPSLVVPMSMKQHYQDVKVTMLITGIATYSMTVLIFMAYNQERSRNAELMENLRNLSSKDGLSGLFNRRELFRRLEIMYGGCEQEGRKETLVREGRYIAMFDVDNFKEINDTYGHGTGDRVLIDIAGVLDRAANGTQGEIAARYGGEEFVCVFASKNLQESWQRADRIRREVEALSWKDIPSLHVTISGGVISCMDDADLTRIMHDVDELLYRAKAAGKNQIFTCADQ